MRQPARRGPLAALRGVAWAVFVWVFNPVMNSRNTALSLGRTSLAVMLAVQAWFILRHPAMFATMGWPPALLLCLVNLFLLSYCLGEKPHVRALAQTIASRFSFGGPVAVAGDLVQSVVGQPAAPDPPVAEDAGDVAPEKET